MVDVLVMGTIVTLGLIARRARQQLLTRPLVVHVRRRRRRRGRTRRARSTSTLRPVRIRPVRSTSKPKRRKSDTARPSTSKPRSTGAAQPAPGKAATQSKTKPTTPPPKVEDIGPVMLNWDPAKVLYPQLEVGESLEVFGRGSGRGGRFVLGALRDRAGRKWSVVIGEKSGKRRNG